MSRLQGARIVTFFKTDLGSHMGGKRRDETPSSPITAWAEGGDHPHPHIPEGTISVLTLLRASWLATMSGSRDQIPEHDQSTVQVAWWTRSVSPFPQRTLNWL